MDIINPYGFIYITTNMYNGKRYIGQKKFDTDSRWKSYFGSGYHLLRVIKKYGKENFVRDIVQIAYSEEELNKLEYEWIRNYNAVKSEDYYNLIDGGRMITALTNKHSIKCICIDNNKVFNSIADAALYSNCSTVMVSNSFKRIHTNNFKNEELIFRPFTYLKEGYSLCPICGKNYIKESNAQMYCEGCKKITKTAKHYKKNHKNTHVLVYDLIKAKRELKKEKTHTKKKGKDDFLEKKRETITDLYVNKKESITIIIQIIKIYGMGLTMTDIKIKLKEWNIFDISRKQSNSWRKNECYINYNAVYNIDNVLIKCFKYKWECREWMVDTNITKINSIAKGIMQKSNKDGSDFNGYIFKDIIKEEYDKNEAA